MNYLGWGDISRPHLGLGAKQRRWSTNMIEICFRNETENSPSLAALYPQPAGGGPAGNSRAAPRDVCRLMTSQTNHTIFKINNGLTSQTFTSRGMDTERILGLMKNI